MDHQEAFETAPPSRSEARARHPRPRLFGQYLLDAGAVAEADVAEALALMRLVNSPMGEIAVGEGILSRDQVTAILAAQRREDGHFLELASLMGVCHDRIEVLCSEQAVENLRFGDALVEIGAVTSTTLEEHLRAYDDEEHFSSPCVRRDASPLTRTVADLLPRVARRALRSAVRFSAARAWSGEALDVHATATSAAGDGLALGLSVEDAVARRFGPKRHAAWTHQLAPLLLADFVGVVMNIAHRKCGIERDCRIVPGVLPERGIVFDVAFEAGCGVLVLDAPG